jgi:hypothetical protein
MPGMVKQKIELNYDRKPKRVLTELKCFAKMQNPFTPETSSDLKAIGRIEPL